LIAGVVLSENEISKAIELRLIAHNDIIILGNNLYDKINRGFLSELLHFEPEKLREDIYNYSNTKLYIVRMYNKVNTNIPTFISNDPWERYKLGLDNQPKEKLDIFVSICKGQSNFLGDFM